MQTPDDKVLVKFLITCFCKSIRGTLQPVPKSGPKNLRGFKYTEGDLVYLETIATGAVNEQTDIRVMLGREGERVQTWGLQIVARMNGGEMHRARVNANEIRQFLLRARENNFTVTLQRLETGERFRLFTDLSYEEVLLSTDPVKPGTVRYSHDIDKSLDYFCGDEEIHFRPERGTPITVFNAHVQGGRL